MIFMTAFTFFFLGFALGYYSKRIKKHKAKIPKKKVVDLSATQEI